MEQPTTQQGALVELLKTYHELNSDCVERLSEPPSPEEFLHIIRRNRPVIISNALGHWPAVERWNSDYLKEKIKGNITVAQTPHG